MKQILAFLFALALGAGNVLADGSTFVWIGPSGDWSDGSNWKGGKAPGSWDYIQIPHTNDALTINVDVAGGVSLRCISSTASGSKTVTFTGETIKLRGWVMLNVTGPVCFRTPIEILQESGRTTQYIESSKQIDFYAPMTIASAIPELAFTGSAAGSGGGPYYFRSTVSGGKRISGQSAFNMMSGCNFKVPRLMLSMGWTDPSNTDYASGMETECIVLGRSFLHIYTADMAPKAVIRPGWNIDPSTVTCGSLYLHGDQTFDRFDDNDMATGVVAWGPSHTAHHIQNWSETLTVTLNGTANGNSPVRLTEKINLIWNPTNDYVQTFSNRTHTMSGYMKVNRGAIRLVGTTKFEKLPTITIAAGAAFTNASTVASSLTALTTLTMGDNAVFAVAASAATSVIKSLSRVTMGYDAKLALAEGCALTSSVLRVNGIYPTPGVYTGADGVAGATKVSWIEGAGTIKVTNANVTSWKAAADGDWDDADNWTGGVPTKDKETLIAVKGSDYAITLSSSSVWPKNISVLCPNATLRVPTGASVVYNCGGTSSVTKFQDGARLLVDGGFCSFTNYVGTFAVGSSVAAKTSSVEVASGTFLYRRAGSTAGQNVLAVNAGGEVRVRGGIFRDLINDSSYAGVAFAGGRLVATGGTYVLPLAGDSGQRTMELGAAEMDFSGHATMQGSDGITLRMNPAAGATASVTFRDTAVKASTGQLRMGGTVGGKSVFTLASAAEHTRFGYEMNVGEHCGDAEFNMSAGSLQIGARSLFVGCAANSSSVGGTKGVFNLSGGALYYDTSDIEGWTDTRPLGVSVGYGGITAAAEGRPYVGEMNVSGGAFTNDHGQTLVGVGYGKGAWTQTGGTYLTRYMLWNPRGRGLIGAIGGEGSLAMSGGTFDFASRLYVGGGTTNDLVEGANFAEKGLPAASHAAVGTLSFSGGTMTLRENLVVGSDGRGTLVRTGTAGTLEVKGTLDLAAQVLDAGLSTETQTEATLRFVYGADGLGAIKAGKVVLRDGTKVEVDFTAYQGTAPRVKLLDTADLTADLSKVTVSFTDDSGRGLATGARLRATASGLYASFAPRGLGVFLR